MYTVCAYVYSREPIQYSQTCRRNLGVTSLLCELKKKMFLVKQTQSKRDKIQTLHFRLSDLYFLFYVISFRELS